MRASFKKFSSNACFCCTFEDVGKLFLRLLFGLSLVINHGGPTFLGTLEANPDFPDPIGLEVKTSMILAGTAEGMFGLFVSVGLCTRLSVIPVIGNFVVAYFVFHAGDPFSQKDMAYLYLSSMVCILLLGPGKYSIDNLLFDTHTISPCQTVNK